jgi:hypothetical protein
VTPVSIAVALLGGVVLGVLVPYVFIAALVPSLSGSQRAEARNFHGREVFYGLGVVWLVWAGCAIVGGVFAGGVLGGRSILPILTLLGPLALVGFALGVVDDAYGTSGARGFKGHLAAMLKGTLTTGGLKLVGMGMACLVIGLTMGRFAAWGIGTDGLGGPAAVADLFARALLAGAAIALTSNLVNLTDLRPGRALKVYSALGIAGVVSTIVLAAHGLPSAGSTPSAVGLAVDAAALCFFVLGPVIAVWRYDLGEMGMLGDAGANPMGAVAGTLIVAGMPLWALGAYFVAVLGLNLASERVSFSRVIEATPWLRAIDMLGRTPDEPEHDEEAKSSR